MAPAYLQSKQEVKIHQFINRGFMNCMMMKNRHSVPSDVFNHQCVNQKKMKLPNGRREIAEEQATKIPDDDLQPCSPPTHENTKER